MANKRYKLAKEQVTEGKIYDFEAGLKLALETATTKFDESIEVAIRLGINPKQADQQVRGALTLPHGLGKKVRILVFAKGEKEAEALKAGADHVGSEDMIEKIKKGWLEFDRVLATPDLMSTVVKVAKILGPKGFMPSPKTGSVTMRIEQAVKSEKKGKAQFRVEKQGLLHVPIGKKSMGFDKIKENYLALMGEIVKLKPQTSKGVYLRSLSVSASMGPGLFLNPAQTQKEVS